MGISWVRHLIPVPLSRECVGAAAGASADTYVGSSVGTFVGTVRRQAAPGARAGRVLVRRNRRRL
ncbi:hypothetical protein LEN_4171 [Lysobacter enzymogenes]|uniref:Uncharacterized protein n=1 Tax=Lysobacter enzymogenes TaxID=69 RepID=A0AAU9AQT0_LYSEN|nr:hypothetical protein LEN_4171 [Lysobacter enzymogenes]